MDAILREVTNNLNQNESREASLTLLQEQNRFFETRLGQVVDRGIDLGIRAIFPDFLEQSVIEVKNALIHEGLREAINTAVQEALDLGRQVMDSVRGVFRSGNDVRTSTRERNVNR